MDRKAKKKIGTDGRVAVNVLLSPETHQRLAELAERDGRPKANLARVLIEEGIERRTVAA
jgi:predicted DNA-binding protein